MKRQILLLIATSALLSAHAQTQYLSDDFSYNAANLVGQGSWSQVGTTSINPIQVVDPTVMTPAQVPLTYAGYSTSGGTAARLVYPGTAAGQLAWKNFGSVAKSGSVYCSFLLRVESAQSNGSYFLNLANVPNNPNNNFAQVFAKSAGAGYNLGINKNRQAPALYGTAIYNFGTTYLVVAKYTINPGALNNDSATLYVFNSGVPATEPATATIGPVGYASPLSDSDSLTTLVLRQNGGSLTSPTVLVDAIRLTSSWGNSAAFVTLPASLLSFTATPRTNATELHWTTGSEHAVASFEVERSRDGQLFEPVCQVPARNQSGGATYSATDAAAAPGTTYYRLKTTDIDGSATYSATALVRGNAPAAPETSLYPNPTSGTVTMTHVPAVAAAVRVLDACGRLVLFVLPTPGSTQTQLDLGALPAGRYLALYQEGGALQSLPVVKE